LPKLFHNSYLGSCGLPWELFTKKGNYRAFFQDPEYVKIISIAAFVHEKNAKYLTKRESFEFMSFILHNKVYNICVRFIMLSQGWCGHTFI